MTPPAAPNESVLPLTAWGCIRERARVHVSSWLESGENAAVVGPLLVYVRAHLSELTRFVLTGASLQLLNLAFLYLLRVWLRLPDAIAVTAMYILGVLAHFPSQRWITYGAQHRPVGPQLRRYAAMLIWNFVIMQVVVGVASRASLSPYIAVMIATVLTMVSNFLIMTHIVFAQERR